MLAVGPTVRHGAYVARGPRPLVATRACAARAACVGEESERCHQGCVVAAMRRDRTPLAQESGLEVTDGACAARRAGGTCGARAACGADPEVGAGANAHISLDDRRRGAAAAVPRHGALRARGVVRDAGHTARLTVGAAEPRRAGARACSFVNVRHRVKCVAVAVRVIRTPSACWVVDH